MKQRHGFALLGMVYTAFMFATPFVNNPDYALAMLVCTFVYLGVFVSILPK